MERKIIQQGKGGYTIYLPKDWVDKKSLKAGDLINITETETDLVIRSKKYEKRESFIEVSKDNRRDLKPLIVHIYRRGADKIIIKNTNENIIREIRKITRDYLLGFEVTEIKENSCTLENISEPSEAKFDTLLRRSFLIVKETINICKQSFKENIFESEKDIQDLMMQQEKFVLFCRRILIKEKSKSSPILGWELLTFLLHIEHAIDYMYRYAASNPIQKHKKILDVLENLEEYFEFYYNAYFKKDVKYIHKLNEYKSKYHFGEILDQIRDSKGENAVIYSYLREIFRLVQIGSSPIFSELLED